MKPTWNRCEMYLALLIWAAALEVGCAPSVLPEDRILVLISIDAFRWDYLEKFKPPNLTRLANEGVRAERLIPAFPTMTFPNHHTIVTGLWPEHHGVVHNNMYDPELKARFGLGNGSATTNGGWWGGEPIWITAVKQGRGADCLMWPGVGASFQNLRPSDWQVYNGKVPPNENVGTALGWLGQSNKPSLVVIYFHQVDTSGHHDGPNSSEVAEAVQSVDTAIGRLIEGIHRLELEDRVNLVIVSDHGMAEVSTNRMIFLPDFVSTNEAQVDFSGAVAGLRPLTGDAEGLYARFAGKENHFRAYQRENLPQEYHFRENPRIPPIILVADEGWYINRRTPGSSERFEKATHGFDPKCDTMGATFIAWGPAFRQKLHIKPVQNIHIYNLLCATMGLKPAPNDGDDRLAREVLAGDAKAANQAAPVGKPLRF